jgi:putative ABC transport system substrate-binding protein
MPVIGVLQTGGSSGASPNWGAFLQGLSETGYVEGRNVAIEHRIAENKFDRLPAFAAELVGRKVDLIFAPTEPAARVAKNSTATIPIVFGVSVDPVAAGLVTTFGRPGGNLTGVSFMLAGLTPKRLELLSELVPPASVFALLVNPNNPNAETIIQEMQEAAREGSAAPCLEGRHRERDRHRFRNSHPTACRRARRRRRLVSLQPTRPARGAGGTLCDSGKL